MKLGKTAEEISKKNFVYVGLPDEYQELHGDVAQGTQIIVHGRRGQGKSSYAFQFARDFAKSVGSVAYLLLEEGYSATTQQKIKRFNLKNIKNITFFDTDEAAQAMRVNAKFYSLYDLVVVDSTSEIQFSEQEIKKLRKAHPKTIFLYVMQATKAGQARGSAKILHECDVEISVTKGVATCEKSRFGACRNYEIPM